MLKLWWAICVFPLVFAWFPAPARAQESSPPPRPPIIVHADSFSELPSFINHFTSQLPDMWLTPRGTGARHGSLWIRSTPSGLYIFGKVDGEQPVFPRAQNEILAKDHVEVWLAGQPDFDLPAIGWGNQFDDETLPKGEASCAEWAAQHAASSLIEQAAKKCHDWATAQSQYRPYLKRLFLRQWLLAPDLAAEESFATPAYDELQARFSNLGDDVPEFMKPGGEPQMFLFPEQSGYSFGISVPFEAFPPLSTLRPADLYVLVDVFSPATPGQTASVYSTSSSDRDYAKPETFNHLRLDPPFSFHLTPCEAPLVGTDKRGEYHPAWFLPVGNPEQNISDAFILVNDPAGYRYDPAGLSPTIRPTHYFWKDAGPGGWVCGPHLTYRKGDQTASLPSTISTDGFDTKRLADGTLLVKTGPRVWYSEFGSGQCGACPRTDLRIFELGAGARFYQILGLGDVVGGPPTLFSQDFTVSPDWSRITQFDLKAGEDGSPGSWSSTTFCLKLSAEKDAPHAYTYEKCAEKENVQPPDPPILKDLRDVQ